MTQKVRICFSETATGETEALTLEVDALDLASVMKALDAHNATLDPEAAPEPWIGDAWVATPDKTTFAFLAHCDNAVYFGSYLINGHVYTQFS